MSVKDERDMTEDMAESNKRRGSYCSKLLSKELMNAARDLRNNPDITIRRADKCASFVILPTEAYPAKTDHILQDESKFTRITRNPVDEIKRKVNNLIESVNAVADDIKLPLLSGDYYLGYMYGNVKNHKPGNPLRPIISQIPTLTYSLAKRLATLLTPYVPDRHNVASLSDFLELVKGLDSSKHIASLDVENLFTNVPINLTISFILDRVYRDVSTPKLKIPEPALKSLLEIYQLKKTEENESREFDNLEQTVTAKLDISPTKEVQLDHLDYQTLKMKMRLDMTY
ncbi:uncharacterized protein LOC143039063 [Oratosquilla oratoria]|uniref:uncharacterized protein LOC143039063 n=1 Tax=Oratosquilla oratoria TaxID=337810 RepID=UPI003F766684